MLVVESFLAAGTQMRLELPGKGCVTLPVDTIEPPIVLLKDNSVVQVTLGNFAEIKGKIQKILFLGDILISFGDFLYTGKGLCPSGYVEEWWVKDLEGALMEKFSLDYEKAAEATQVSVARLNSFLDDPFRNKPTAKEAILLSLSMGIPLHPTHTFFWSNLPTAQDVELLKTWLSSCEVE